MIFVLVDSFVDHKILGKILIFVSIHRIRMGLTKACNGVDLLGSLRSFCQWEMNAKPRGLHFTKDGYAPRQSQSS